MASPWSLCTKEPWPGYSSRPLKGQDRTITPSAIKDESDPTPSSPSGDPAARQPPAFRDALSYRSEVPTALTSDLLAGREVIR